MLTGSMLPASGSRANGCAGYLRSRHSAFEVGRMGRAVDFLELANCDMGVDLGGSQIGVPQHGLYEPDVRAAFQH